MEEIKKEFEEPVVEKVEFDFSERIAASGCQDTVNPGGGYAYY